MYLFVRARLATFFLSLVFCGVNSLSAQGLSGKFEAIARYDTEDRARYELNLFKGSLKDSEGKQFLEMQGGLGYLGWDEGFQDLAYGTLLARSKDLNNLTFIFNHSENLREETDYQGRVSLTDSLDLYGGYSSTGNGIDDTGFGGIAYRRDLPFADAEVLVRGGYVDFQGNPTHDSSLIMYDDKGSVGFHVNEEQFRAGIGYMDKDGIGWEGLFIENSPGSNGPLAFMGHFTIKCNHPLLSNVARESRILGSTSVSYENPILRGSQFLNPYTFANFNRLQYVQDFGDKLNVRVRAFDFPGGNRIGQTQLVLFPTQLMSPHTFFDKFFFGATYDWFRSAGADDTDRFGLLGGLKLIPLSDGLSVSLVYEGVGLVDDDGGEIGHDILAFFTLKV